MTTAMLRARAFLLALAVCAAAKAAGAAQPAADHEFGRKIYNFRCYYCHGYSGDARTLASTYLTPKPRDFSTTPAEALPRDRMLRAVREGRPGTAMQGFRGILTGREIEAVVDFVRDEFLLARAPNTRYHTAQNGWPDHDRYAVAFPFARGELHLGTPPDRLSPQQRAGRRLYLTSCISCHDRGRPPDEQEVVWQSRPLSYPLHGDTPTNQPPPQMANPYRAHERAPRLSALNPREKRGEKLFQSNCAFCHAADGTGRNWIGAFMDPPARDLTGPDIAGITHERLMFVIREGLPGTSMPAWKSVLSAAEVDAVAAYVLKAFRANDRTQTAARP